MVSDTIWMKCKILYTSSQGRSERGWGRRVTPPIIVLSRHLEPRSANEASKVLEQGLVQDIFSVGRPRAVGLRMYRVSEH